LVRLSSTGIPLGSGERDDSITAALAPDAVVFPGITYETTGF
jgi:hypothetical protein